MEANDAVNVINGTPISIKEGKSFILLTRNVPALFSEGFFSIKRGLEVRNFLTFPNTL